jgi:hypothetical protein
MLTHQDGGPRVNSIEDFAIFAQPNRMQAVEAAVRAAAQEGAKRWPGRAIAIDMTPTGVTAPESQAGRAGRRDIRILELGANAALIETPEGYRRIRPGDGVEDLGKIISIRRMGEYWVVVASLRSLVQAAPPSVQR